MTVRKVVALITQTGESHPIQHWMRQESWGNVWACVIVLEVHCEQTLRREYWCVRATSPLAFLHFAYLTLQPKQCVLTTVLRASFSRLGNEPTTICYITRHSVHHCNLFPRLLSYSHQRPSLVHLCSAFMLCNSSIAWRVCLHWKQRRQRLPALCSGSGGCCIWRESWPFWMCSVQSESLKDVVKIGAFCRANAPAVFQRPVSWPNPSLFSLCWQKARLSGKPILLPILKFGYYKKSS